MELILLPGLVVIELKTVHEGPVSGSDWQYEASNLLVIQTHTNAGLNGL